MAGSILGTAVRRVEDPALLTGERAYTEDLRRRDHPDALHLVFARTDVAHATIRSIDLDGARGAPGVVGVYLDADLGIRPYSPLGVAPVAEPLLRPPLAADTVRFVGEAVAAVLAESEVEAVDAAAQVFVDYDMLPAVADAEAALAPDAPVLHPAMGSNVATTFVDPGAELPTGEAERVAGWLGDADVVVRARFENQRIAVMPMEASSVLALPGADGRLTVYCSTQAPHIVKGMIADLAGIEPERVHIATVAVGGGFGAKSAADPEYVIAAVLALRHGRPVAWKQTRSENLLAMHARAQRQYVQLGARRDGTLVGVRADIIADAGAYPAIATYLPILTRNMMSGVYSLPAIESTAVCVATNTVPTTAYRGAGRPEAAHLLERSMDMLAAELGIDPVELRRRNLIPADAFPYHSPTGAVYDVGDYAKALDRVCELAGYRTLRADQASRRGRNDRIQLGIGVSVYVEVTAGAGPSEFAGVEVHPDETVTVRVGTASHGQGHATTFAQIAADALGIAFDRIRLVDGDTDRVPRGEGTFSSRSVQVGGVSVWQSSLSLVERAKELAAHLLEASVDDIVRHDDGRFGVAGVPTQSLGWGELASAAADEAVLPEGFAPGLAVEGDWERPSPTYPFGAHIAVVEVDTESGSVRWVDHVAVDDCGTIINPLLAEGQVHGGVAQGGSQALFEQAVYADDATPMTATLVDYLMPSAAELPSFRTAHTVTPTPVNPLGAKGIGESGTIGAMPAVHNAVIDALSPFGITHIDMPLTPERIWRAIQASTADA